MSSPFSVDEDRFRRILQHIDNSAKLGADPLFGVRQPSVAAEPPESMPPRLRGLLYEPLDDFKVDSPVQLFYSPLFNYTIEHVFGPDEQNYVAQLTQSAATDLRTGNRPLSRLMVAMAVSDIEPARAPMSSVLEAMRHHPSYKDIYDLVQIDKAQKQRMRLHAEGEKMKAVKNADVEHEIMHRGVQYMGDKAAYKAAVLAWEEAVRKYWNSTDKDKGVPPKKPDPENYWDIGDVKNELFRTAMRAIPEKKQLLPRTRAPKKKMEVDQEEEAPVPEIGITVAETPAPKIKKAKTPKKQAREVSLESGADSDVPIAKALKKSSGKKKVQLPSEFNPEEVALNMVELAKRVSEEGGL